MALCAALAAAAACSEKEDDNKDNGATGGQGGGVTWATCNVDDFQTFAAKPDMYTKFYQWNRSTAWSATDQTVSGWDSTRDTSTWTVNPCPAGWRLPTKSEFEALHNAGSSWAEANTRGNAVAGRFYGANHATATMSNLAGCVFFPANGFRNNNTGGLSMSHGSYGSYWSSTQESRTGGFSLNFDSNNSRPSNYDYKNYGLSLRCVK